MFQFQINNNLYRRTNDTSPRFANDRIDVTQEQWPAIEVWARIRIYIQISFKCYHFELSKHSKSRLFDMAELF